MSQTRFVNKELMHAAGRTTARLITGFEDDVPVYHAFEVIKWDGDPNTAGTVGTVDEWNATPATTEGMNRLRELFRAHAVARI